MTYLLLLFSIPTFAHIVLDDVSVKEKTYHSFKSVCSAMFSHEMPLIEASSSTELDCMSKKLNVGEFCEKIKAADPYYLRAYIDKEKKAVVCVSGTKVMFKYQCVRLSDKQYCDKEAKKSCLYIKDKLAKRLELVHSSFVENDKGVKELNCFFDSLQALNSLR